MEFEKCSLYIPGEWEKIDSETLLREVSNEQIDMMIWFKATVRCGSCQYRRVIPAEIVDWSKELVSS